MKAKQGMRRLAALTLATTVMIPQAEPAIAASLKWGRTEFASLSGSKLSTQTDRKTGAKVTGGYPLLTLPKSFQQKISVPISVVQNGMETSHALPPSQTEKEEETSPVTTPEAEQTDKSLPLPVVVMRAEEKTPEQTTEINSDEDERTPAGETTPEEGSGSGKIDGTELGGSDGEKTDQPAGPEEITDVNDPLKNQGETGASDDVVMPPESGEAPPEEEQGGQASDVPEQGEEPEEPEQPDGGEEPLPPVEGEDEEPEEPDQAPDQVPDGEETSAPEEPLPPEEPVSPEQTPPELSATFAARETPYYQAYKYLIGYGVPLVMDSATSDDPTRIEEYGGQFRVELDSGVDQTLVEDYGYRVCSSTKNSSVPNIATNRKAFLYTDPGGDSFSYCVFPTLAMLGRVPDRTFEGWYVYPYGAKVMPSTTPLSDSRSWAYGDYAVDSMHRMGSDEIVSYGDSDVIDPEKRALGDTWDNMRSYGDMGYRDATEHGDDIGSSRPQVDSENPVSFVGRWGYSDESRAADVNRVKGEDGDPLETAVTLTVDGKALPLYKSEIIGLHGDALKDYETHFDRGENGGRTEYWLRVGSTVDSLDLEFNAAEIYYAYNSLSDKTGVDSPIQVTWNYAGKPELSYTAGTGVAGSSFTSRMLPEGTTSDGVPSPSNSYDDPAYSRWSVTNIALDFSSPGEEGEGYRYNDITVTVAPPSVYAKQRAGEELTDADRAKCTTYVFHVQRLTEPTLTQNSGNTPMGMIERDTTWESEEQKQAAKEAFVANNALRFSTQYGEYPRGPENNGGSIFRDTYSHTAWNLYGSNVDLDPNAVVVYQNSAFLDPGVALTDSEGNPVPIRPDSDWRVVRKLELKTAEKLTVENLSKGSGMWYKGGQLLDTQAGDTLTGNDAQDQIDLRGQKVLPGIYQIEYELVDPVAGTTYRSNADSFATPGGKAGAVNFRRTLVVLPIPGDVDMDGSVTSADAEILRKNLTDATQTQQAQLGGVFLGTHPSVDLFAYRVADVDHDGTVDKRLQNNSKVTDVDQLETIPRAQLINVSEESSKSDYYYIPLPSLAESASRQPLTVDKNASGARLQLVYLGKERSRTVTGSDSEGYVTDPYGPWRSGGAWETGTDSTEQMELFETMWVGVKLTDGAASELLAGKGVDTFTFSLVYDVRYLEPTSVLTQDELDSVGGSGASSEQRWLSTLRLYNMGARSQTAWGSNYSYNFTRATQRDRSFAAYDAKAITPLEQQAMAEGRTSHLRELVFSITLDESNQGRTQATLDDTGKQWLLAVPFTLIQHPVGQTSYQGVEMQAGMSEFTLLLDDNSPGGETVTAAYHPLVTDIFGGNTANLRSTVSYVNAGPQVPLGQDHSKVYYIRSEREAGTSSGAKDVVYSQYFEAKIGWQKNGDEYEYVHEIPAWAIMRYAPDWLNYDTGTGIISGIPEAAGTYYFTVAQYRYQLDVSPAPLHYWADNQNSYYGENEFRGPSSPDFTFRYAPEDIQSIDNARATASGGTIQNDGQGKSLKALLNDITYIEPEFTAVDQNGQAVLYTTPVSQGAYPIETAVPAQSNNYDMIYSPDRAGGDMGLGILPRPLRIEKLLVENVGMIYNDRAVALTNREAVLSNTSGGKKEFSTQLIRDEDGTYVGLPLEKHDYLDGVLLPGDSLILQYRAELLQTEEDKRNSPPIYTLTEREEPRVAEISDLKIIGGRNSDSYTIFEQNTPLVNGEEAGVVGTVRRRNIIRFDIVRVPPLEYHTGDQLSQANALWFNIVKEGDGPNAVEGTYPYNQETTFAEHGVKVTWATKEEMERGEEGSLDYVAMQTFDMRYDGRYLCLSTRIGIDEQGNPETVKTLYTNQPLKIIPRALTLTAVEGSRFYGEENGALKYTYNPRELSIADQAAILEKFGGSLDNTARDGKELEEVLGERFTPPQLKAVDEVNVDDVEESLELTAASRYTGSTTNAVLIYGAHSDDYDIQYTYTSREDTVTQEEWGASPYSIRKRYIVVDALVKDRSLVTIYADAKRIYASGLQMSADEVALGLPQHTADSVTYYPRYGATAPVVQEMGYAEDSLPIVNGDQVSFTYTATVASQDGEEYVRWTNFAKGYFNMGQESSKSYPVQVENLQLTGRDANNYELVYRDNTSARFGTPGLLKTLTNCISPESNARQNYYVPQLARVEQDGSLTATDGVGYGTVTLRPIKEIQIRSAGKLSYTYGENYAPDERENRNGRGMQIYIRYDTVYENYEGNVTEGLLDYNISHYDGTTPVTTFDERGLKVYYQKGTEEPRELTYRELLTIESHDGAKILVTGKRGEQAEAVWSAPSERTLTVLPKTLTLRAEDCRRVYGEANPDVFPFTYRVSELAPQDRAKLAQLSGWSDMGWNDGGDLARLGLAYQAPVFQTRASQRSAVLSRGREGYDISVNLPGGSVGSLANYRLEYEPGTLYIYPRLVQLDQILKNPVYTIYSDLSDNIVYTNLFADGPKPDFTLALPQGGQYHPDGAPNGVYLEMRGPALVLGDTMTLRVQVDFGDWKNWAANPENKDKPLNVTVSNAELLSTNDNYVLDTALGTAVILNPAAKGKVELRSISSIEIVNAPDKLEYNYGDTLDLTGLTVMIRYTTGGEEMHTTVVFRRADDFAANGLYVNYYPSSTLLQEDDGHAAWARLREKYYIADTGDHLTIAPTHGSMASSLAQGDPKREFSADGKYLIVTAQRDSKHEAAAPVVVTDFATKQPVRIKVNPRPITFRLKAEDKTYDGTVAAAGTIQFENIYRRQGYVDANNRDVTDMVYPVTGAYYEGLWGEKLTQSGNQDFTRYVTEQGGYRFSTGSYAGVQTSPLEENTPIQWSEGYTYGAPDTMTFSYLDPNVAYETPPGDHSYGEVTYKPVQVTGLRLGGADAANYTLAPQVTQEDLAAGTYQGVSLPTATIYKANRAPLSTEVLPKVEVDPGTNVVRTVFDQPLSAIRGGEQPQYEGELHFEYALQYQASAEPTDPDEEATVVVEQRAGAQGQELWWDERYYGGEAVTVEYPEGYVPREEDLPQPDDGEDQAGKGQSYPWAREDSGFVLDVDAYPGSYGQPWSGYDLYRTDRTALTRNQIYWPVVRAAETHNYNASPVLSSVEGYTPAMVQAVLDAAEAVQEAGSQGEAELAAAREELRAASAAALEALTGALEGAGADARREAELLAQIAEAKEWPEDWTGRAPAAAVKTYAQSLELVSVEELEGADPSGSDPARPGSGDKQTYQVPTLEAVWFTDVQDYPNKEMMDAVVRNLTPVRYRDYTWDEEGNTPLFDQEEGLSLREPFEVEITQKGEQGEETTQRVTVNEDNRARIYVKLRSTSSGGMYFPPVEEELRIESEDLKVTLGADPIRLTAQVLPKGSGNWTIRWSSSDESVATVDPDGTVHFVGVGVAVITATAGGGLSDSITVTVLPEEWQEWFAQGIFNVAMQEPFFQMDEGELLFHPEWYMTRGEAAQMLIQFYVEDPNWVPRGPESYPDLTGRESYAQAALTLSKVGVFQGLPDGRFGGDQIITRAEFIVLLGRMLGLETPDTTGKPHAFLDTGEEDTWAYSEIDALSQYPGLLQGVGEGFFAPRRPITRAEASVFLTRLLQAHLVGEEPLIPKDVMETHWARGPILRAVNQGVMPPEQETGEEKPEESKKRS